MGMGILTLSLLLSIYAGLRNKIPFVADVILDSNDQSKFDNKLNNSLGTITEESDESLMQSNFTKATASTREDVKRRDSRFGGDEDYSRL